mmetsp:Transcript_8845/g.38970  ORF Transcript_8845/g.38970 Transcript_8845/m.38970 type:complete len:201 (+) Transcript_8845:110-712(+)
MACSGRRIAPRTRSTTKTRGRDGAASRSSRTTRTTPSSRPSSPNGRRGTAAPPRRRRRRAGRRNRARRAGPERVSDAARATNSASTPLTAARPAKTPTGRRTGARAANATPRSSRGGRLRRRPTSTASSSTPRTRDPGRAARRGPGRRCRATRRARRGTPTRWPRLFGPVEARPTRTRARSPRLGTRSSASACCARTGAR